VSTGGFGGPKGFLWLDCSSMEDPDEIVNGLDTPGTALPLPEWVDGNNCISEPPNSPVDGNNSENDFCNSCLDRTAVCSEDGVSISQPVFDLANLDAVISEAASSNGTRTGLQYPWQQGIMASIFGETKDMLLPQIDMPVGYFDPVVSQSLEPAASNSVVTSSKTVFESCVQFGLFRTKLEDQDVQLKLVMLRWEAIIMHCPRASSVGRFMESLDKDMQTSAVRTALGGRSNATLRKRASQVKRYMQWGLQDNPDAILFPLVLDDTRKYFKHLTDVGAARSVFTGWIECVGFLTHVLGVDSDPNIHLDPLVRGTLRGMSSTRPRRKQSRPFRVSELVVLEEYLMCDSHSIVDRYICGCILFAVFACARFGDLRDIEKFVEDIPEDHPELGFIEMHSASHKMRSSADGLGLALPLVAPVRGFSTGLWGVQFCKVARMSGLAFDDRPRGSLIAAPDPLGSWTSRSLTNAEVGRWFRSVLEQAGGSENLSALTPHGAKATLLSYLARYGAAPSDRLILGHHSVKKFGALETYSRDLLSGPLRILQKMIGSVKDGTFHPDETRSGIFKDVLDEQQQQPEDLAPGKERLSKSALVVSPNENGKGDSEASMHETLDDMTDDGYALVDHESNGVTAASRFLTDGELHEHRDGEGEGANDSLFESDSGSSDSSSSSSCGSDDDIFGTISGERAERTMWKEGCVVYQHVKSKALHLYPEKDAVESFLCGRKISKAYKIFTSPVYCNEWKCKQCNVGKPVRSYETAVAALDRAFKRHKK